MIGKYKGGRLKRSSAIKKIESAINHMDSGKIIITVEKKKIAQVEFLDKDWCQDVWSVGGGGI